MKHKRKRNFRSIAVFMITVICLLAVGLTLIRNSGHSVPLHISFIRKPLRRYILRGFVLKNI